MAEGRPRVFAAVTGRGSTMGDMGGPDRFAVVCILTCAIVYHYNKQISVSWVLLHFLYQMTVLISTTFLSATVSGSQNYPQKSWPCKNYFQSNVQRNREVCSMSGNSTRAEPTCLGCRFCYLTVGWPCLKNSRKNDCSRTKFHTALLLVRSAVAAFSENWFATNCSSKFSKCMHAKYQRGPLEKSPFFFFFLLAN